MTAKIGWRDTRVSGPGQRLDKLRLSSQGCALGVIIEVIPPAESVVQDKRVHPRVNLDAPVSCQPHDGAPIAGVAKDISIGGMFIEATESLPFGTEITIVLRLPGAKVELRLPGIVRWVKPVGFGVQFGSMGARETHAISELLKH
jgi:hypothetical protein